MVQRGYIKCPICEKVYQLKIQVDQNINIYDWPICFECKDCGEPIRLIYSKNGLLPKNLILNNPDNITVTTIGYSSSLPVTDGVYMKDLDEIQSKLLFSLFMNIQRGYFTDIEVANFDAFLTRLQQNLLPYKGILQALLPIMKKGNHKAFSKKMAVFFNMKKYDELVDAQAMYDAFFDLIEKSHLNLCPQRYLDDYYNPFIAPMFQFVENADMSKLRAIKNTLDESGKISLWYKDEALPYISKMLEAIQELIPVMICASAGESNVVNRGDLKIVTISCKDALAYYQEGYETIVHGLKIVVGINNILENGDIDKFTNPKLGDVDTLTKFANKPGGKMLEHLSNYTSINKYLDGSINNKIRNAASHGEGGVDYDPETQQLRCYYDDSDRAKYYDTSLMAVCRICYIQLLHIMETTLLARSIVEKAK